MAGRVKESNFPFVRNSVLRENLDRVFNLILELITLVESGGHDPLTKSGLRKTIVIYTASIIEALLLFCLEEKKPQGGYVRTQKEFKISKRLYQTDAGEEIVVGHDVEQSVSIKLDKMNLDQATKLSFEHKIISKALAKRINEVRDMRNRQHLTGMDAVDKDYTERDLAFVFEVAKEVKKRARDISWF